MKQGRTLFVHATAAEAKAKAERGDESLAISALRIELASQALVGMGNWTPYPEGWGGLTAATHAEMLGWRAEWAVAQADAMLVALGLVEGESQA